MALDTIGAMDWSIPTHDVADDSPYRDSRGRRLPDPRALHSLELRYLLTDLIASGPGRAWTVAELVEVLEQAGFEIPDRASKTVSDQLRWEVGRGRVVRVGRGRYRMGSIPGSTRRRIRTAARHRRDLLAAVPPSWSSREATGSLDP